MSQQKQVGPFIDCGGGLVFISTVLLATLRSVEDKGFGGVLTFADNSTQELSSEQLRKFRQALGIEETLIKPAVLKLK